MSAALGWSGLIVLVVALSASATGLLRRYALARSLLDIPNARSSHAVPTPRGGGVAIVVSFLLALPMPLLTGALSPPAFWALAGAGIGVALIGFLDDHGHVAARWRLLAHFAAAAWALAWLGGAPAVTTLGVEIATGGIANVLAAIYLVWLLNLYNFMDGIDGIAAVEAVCVGAGGAVLYALAERPELGVAPLLLAAAAGGFLVWNFPPARIFMGDAGSGFLGIALGVMSLQAAACSPPLFWAWTILLGAFIVDATVTLLRRLLRGDKVWQAHRSHAYQHAARRCGRHLPVTLAVGAINLGWLLPFALLVGSGRLDGAIGVPIAYLPLLVLAWRLRAGLPEAA